MKRFYEFIEYFMEEVMDNPMSDILCWLIVLAGALIAVHAIWHII